MDEPDVLDVGGRPRRRTVWVAVALAVAVVGGLGVVRVAGMNRLLTPIPSTSPSVSSSSSAATSQAWPVDANLPSGTLYVMAKDGVHAIDARSGLVTNTDQDADIDPATTLLTPLADGVLAWSTDGGPFRLLTDTGVLYPRSVPGLGSVNMVVPGADAQVWVGKVDYDHLDRTTRYTLIDGLGGVAGRARLAGLPFPDGSGGLFALDVDSAAHVYPGPAEQRVRWVVVAVGPDGYVRTLCPQRLCVTVLHDRASGAETTHAELQDATEGAALSPGNRFVAGVTLGGDRVSVRQVGSGRVVRSFPEATDGGGVIWLSERWLVAVSGHGLTLYDVEADRMITTTLPFSNVSQLVWSPV